ncbi:hypothetical protein DVJ78_01910 [Humibacter sp. BT305]|nr:hypothetical protein DVJ78_01910 [Humibacter sp. BT305]
MRAQTPQSMSYSILVSVVFDLGLAKDRQHHPEPRRAEARSLAFDACRDRSDEHLLALGVERSEHDAVDVGSVDGQ